VVAVPGQGAGEHRLVIEIDGGHHLDQRAADAARERWLEEQGFRVLRFWDSDVLNALESVEEAILIALTEPWP
jgi:crossover junction endodeoxyribonuclease RuvC